MSEQFSEHEFQLKFEVLFKQYFKSLCFHAMSFVKDEDVAKDIVHDVFLNVWNHRFSIDFCQPMAPYLIGLTRNRSCNYLDHLKVKDRHAQHELTFAELCSEADASGQEELIAQVMERIDRLPERCREVMRLCFLECKKYKEIAEMLDISVNTVKTHITTGLKILRDEFSSSGLILFFSYIRKQNPVKGTSLSA